MGYENFTESIFISFRGSIENLTNWSTNIKAFRIKYPKCDCYVHEGFYNGFLTIETKMKSAYNTLKFKYPNAKLYITGHSAGGAYAIFGALSIN